jgi:copper chaperone CopZ
MRTTVHIQNLKCGGCERTIIDELSHQKNISDVEVSQLDQTVSFDYHTNHDYERAKHVLSAIGYPLVGAEIHPNIEAESDIG